MPGPGFIHGKLDTKMLTLYILSHVAAPIDFATLTDLVMCDDGVDYFLFAEGVSELLESAHASKNGDFYWATDKGRRNSADLESSLPSVIRRRPGQSVRPFPTGRLTEGRAGHCPAFYGASGSGL